VKTGTTNDARDLGTYGFLPPTTDGLGLVVGVWMGNSDHSYPRTKTPATSLTGAAPLWRAFMREYTGRWPVTAFKRPSGVVQATIDAWSGGRPGPWTRDRTREWFNAGTQPGAAKAIDRAGLLYRAACGGWRVDPVQAELGSASWKDDVADWVRRAHRGAGVVGRFDSATAYFWGERSWGGSLIGQCRAPAPARDHGNGSGHHKGKKPKPSQVAPTPAPQPTVAPTPPAA
jgi:membrane peptidoglycan carboxypeptidase